MEDELNNLKTILRSIVVSCPTEVDVRSLVRDYREMIGTPIPINKYGYHDLITFLKERCNDSFLFQGPASNPILTLIVPDTLKHIDKLVQKQKTPFTKFRGKRRSVQVSTVKSLDSETDILKKKNPLHKQESIVYNNTDFKYQQKCNSSLSKNESLQNENVETNHIDQKQLINQNGLCLRDTQQLPRFKESIQDIECSTTESDSSRQISSSCSSSSKGAQLEELIEEITSIVYEHPDGLWCTDILKYYRKRYGHDMDFLRFGYTSIVRVVLLAPTLKATQMHTGDWRVWAAETASPRLPALPSVTLMPHPPQVDPDDALPGVDCETEVFPADCLHFTENIPAASLDEVCLGDMLEVMVGEVYSPSHFWLMRLGERYNISMENIMDEMTAYYGAGAGRERRLARSAVRMGHYCSGCYEGDWHRSIIVKAVDSYTVKVRHVDYGTVETVPIAELKPLRREWAQLPAQAVRARLADAAPPASGRRWPHPSSAAFLALVKQKRLFANIIDIDKTDNILEVRLIDTSTEEDICITSELVRANHAERCNRSAPSTSECYLWPKFVALENGDTPNYADILAYLRHNVELEFLEEYRRHVPPCLPSPPRSITAGTAVAKHSTSQMINPLPFSSNFPPGRQAFSSNYQIPIYPIAPGHPLAHAPESRGRGDYMSRFNPTCFVNTTDSSPLRNSCHSPSTPSAYVETPSAAQVTRGNSASDERAGCVIPASEAQVFTVLNSVNSAEVIRYITDTVARTMHMNTPYYCQPLASGLHPAAREWRPGVPLSFTEPQPETRAPSAYYIRPPPGFEKRIN